MADTPTLEPGDRKYISCPSCTIQIPADAGHCPFCRQPIGEASRDFRDLLVPPERFPGWRRRLSPLWEEYGKWLKVAAPVLLAALVLWVAYGLWSGLKVRVASDNAFLIEASQEKSGKIVLLRGKLTNRGEDVPDLSLHSIGVIAEFRYRDGRTERRRFFPKSPYRGEGALMRGETGAFEIEVPREVTEVFLRGEVVNLGEDRTFFPAGDRTRRLPMQKRR